MESSESLFPFLGKAGSLYPRENPTIEFFKEAGSRRQQGWHPGTAQSSTAHPQSPQDPQPDPQFPPAASPPPSKAGKNRQLVQREGSQNNERKSRVGNPVPIRAAGKKVQLSPPRFSVRSGDGGGKRQVGETAPQESSGAGFTPCKSRTHAPAPSFRHPEGSQLSGGMSSARSPSPQ